MNDESGRRQSWITAECTARTFAWSDWGNSLKYNKVFSHKEMIYVNVTADVLKRVCSNLFSTKGARSFKSCAVYDAVLCRYVRWQSLLNPVEFTWKQIPASANKTRTWVQSCLSGFVNRATMQQCQLTVNTIRTQKSVSWGPLPLERKTSRS
jgi:hypothetical protein